MQTPVLYTMHYALNPFKRVELSHYGLSMHVSLSDLRILDLLDSGP